MADRLIALFLLLFFSPLFIGIALIIKATSAGSIFYIQKRLGKNKKVFSIIKFRTMIKNADLVKKKYTDINQGALPFFKIKNDPRFTRFGKLISHVGLDELPQLINVIKGEMNIIGPRPLPVHEGNQITQKYYKRFSVLPGISSPAIVYGGHSLGFKKWMDLDLEYVQNKSLSRDLYFMIVTFFFILKLVYKEIFRDKILKAPQKI